MADLRLVRANGDGQEDEQGDAAETRHRGQSLSLFHRERIRMKAEEENLLANLRKIALALRKAAGRIDDMADTCPCDYVSYLWEEVNVFVYKGY